MIGKVLRSGGTTGGLVRYLFAPGRNSEHLDPRVIAGSDAELAPTVDDIVSMLDASSHAAGLTKEDRGVYHLILSSAKADGGKGLPADRPLSDAEWAGVAEDTLSRAGLTGNPGVGNDVRWVAVRHDQPGAEHVHVVAVLATENGRRVHPRNDFYRIGEACRDAERRLGLRETAPRDRTSTPPPTRAETERAERSGREPSRVTLRREVRAAAAGATGETDFLSRLRERGVLVRERHSQRDGSLTGYAVALPGQGRAGRPVYFSGGKLASDLTLPKLARRWNEALPPTAQQEQAWTRAVRAAGEAARAVAAHRGDPRAAADAAWAASDFLSVAARQVDGRRAGTLGEAAAAFDRAAREGYGRTPPPSRAGSGLRAASALLAASHFARPEARQLLALLAQLAALSDAVTRLREAQGRQHQAEAARRAAERLRTAHDRQAALVALPARRARASSAATNYESPALTSRPERTAAPGRGIR